MSQISDIAGSQSLRQTGRLPISNAADPILDTTEAFEILEAGKPIPCVVIFTALQVEHRAVCKHLPRFTEESYKGTIYNRGTFMTINQVWDVVVTCINAGNSGISAEVERAIERFSPRVILLVGVAGAMKQELKIGDVVVGTKIYKYETGKALAHDILPRPDVNKSDHALVERAKAVAQKLDWLNRIMLDSVDAKPSVFVEAIASGEKVIASSQSPIYKFLKINYDDTYAVEMEGFGFLEGARRNSDVKAIVVRGISDKLDKKAQADASGSQQIAAAHASAFAFEMISNLDGWSESITNTHLEEQKVSVGKYEGDHINIDLRQKPPVEIAVIRFQQHTDSYSLYIHHASMPHPFEKMASGITLPKILGKFGAVYPWSMETVGDLENYNPTKCLIGEALKALKSLRDKEPKFACLIIEEPQDSIVPWELLNWDRDKTLGEELQTVRSRSGLEDNDVEIQTNPQTEYRCHGPALVYTSTAMAEINSNFLGFQAYAHELSCHDQPKQVLEHFKKIDISVGLVIMADLALHQVTSGERTVYLKRTRLLKEAASVVMLHLTMAEDGGRGQREVAKAFLRHGARGVLGMLVSIDNIISRQIMNDFFTEYGRASDLPIPEILLRLRKAIAQRFKNDTTDEISRLYLATFLYAYYGHPMTVLKLTPANQ